jgi:hypothetical protein
VCPELGLRKGLSPLKFKVVACDIMRSEVEEIAPQSPHELDLTFLTREGYHNEPDKNRPLLQEQIDAVPEGYDAILLGFAFCNRLLDGIQARHTQLIVPRGHDCITFFMGSRQRYREFFDTHPGTYYYTRGWLERRDGKQLNQMSEEVSGIGNTDYDELVKKYGEENAQYLTSFFDKWQENYTNGVLIQFPFAEKLNLREQVKEICYTNAWKYDEMAGDLGLLTRWLKGEWNDDFLIVPPGYTIKAAYDETIMKLSC